ncbi:hypothetical protein CkaCkLH20_04548 [Colletotrichum karsti]|uniref:Zn(2)-C6 fungal-type domain-containing protein n=1 Tax=Colletotrichum karsti TaxID=1095194 RepID=A0A9P6I909_9PEZI|nr:uncharacterized protein CkaCkLH20_04548 [Colletotrichum karsti]KAF9877972.1 hypothetical protein CkaCkLH20_04548 [Colletotrichum karsti]
MPSPISTAASDSRKRKSHKKSRHGCGNCKLRRVKCDETKPGCKKCVAYGVTCVYGPASDAAALSVEVAFQVCLTPARKTTPSPASTGVPAPPRYVPPPLPCTGSVESPDPAYQLTAVDVRLLERFQKRTVLSLGTPSSREIYERKTLPIAFCHPFLMHTILAATHLHDMSLANTSPEGNPAFTYHWYRGVSMLHRKLSQPIVPSERDALWITAALVGVGSFANMSEVRSPSEAWPLREASWSDLDWMKLGDGKKQVWRLTDPMRSEGIFRDVANELYTHLMSPYQSLLGEEDVDFLESHLPAGFCELYGLREGRPEDNPYWTAAEALAMCWSGQSKPGSLEAVKPFLGFISKLDPRYKSLLEEKDERAMLMLAYCTTRAKRNQTKNERLYENLCLADVFATWYR